MPNSPGQQGNRPFSVSTERDNSLSAVGIDRADFMGTDLEQVKLDGQSHGQMQMQFFDTSLFAANAIGTFGNTGKDILRGPRYFNTDLGIIKDTRITDGVNVQFRAEFFNILNNVNFGNPGSNFSSPSF